MKLIRYLLLGLLAGILLLLIAFFQPNIPLETLKERYAPLPSAFVNVMGMDIHYRDEGPKTDSLPLVLLHGTGASLHTWEGWTSYFAKNKRVIRLDLPAFGLTGPTPDDDYAMGTYVAVLHAFFQKTQVTSCILAGNSLGGAIAWHYALTHPEQVDRLVLVNSAGYPFQSASQPIAFRMARVPVVKSLFKWITPRSVVRKSLENVYADPSKVTEELVTQYYDLSCREGNRAAFVARMNQGFATDSWKQIPSIKQPTLILWGEEDRLIPIENAHRFAQDLSNDTLVVLPGLGHVPMEENPERSAAAVAPFVLNRP